MENKDKLLQVKYADEPTLFDDIEEFFIERFEEPRKGSSYFLQGIVEFKEEHAEDFEDVEDFSQYVGTWITNTLISDWDYGHDEAFTELTRVHKKETVTFKWVEDK